jgi:hypothetical protein
MGQLHKTRECGINAFTELQLSMSTSIDIELGIADPGASEKMSKFGSDVNLKNEIHNLDTTSTDENTVSLGYNPPGKLNGTASDRPHIPPEKLGLSEPSGGTSYMIMLSS